MMLPPVRAPTPQKWPAPASLSIGQTTTVGSTSITTASTGRSSTRAERLAKALAPPFVTAQPLSNRHTPIADIVGPLAPERYASLPPMSREAAKALIAVAICKDVKDARRMEQIRLRKNPDVLGNDDEWFRAVKWALLEKECHISCIQQAKSTLKDLRIGDNSSEAIPRLAVLPRNALRVDSELGVDFTEAVAVKKPDSLAERLRKLGVFIDDDDESGDKLLVRRPLTATNGVMANGTRRVPKKAQTLLGAGHRESGAAAHFHSDSKGIEDVAMTDVAPLVVRENLMQPQPSRNPTEARANERVKLPVSLKFDDVSGTVSIDFDIIPANKRRETTNNHEHHDASSTAQEGQPSSAVQGASTEPITCNLREDAPRSNLQTLMAHLHGEPSESAAKLQEQVVELDDADADADIVIVDVDNEAPVNTTTPRRKARKHRTVQAKKSTPVHKTEERASRMRSAVVSALQDDTTPSRRKRTTRTPRRKPLLRTTPETARRSSRRKKSVTPAVVESSDSDGDMNEAEVDDDFQMEDAVEILPPVSSTRANGHAVTDPPSSPQAPVPSPPTSPPQRSAPRFMRSSRASSGRLNRMPPAQEQEQTLDRSGLLSSGRAASPSQPQDDRGVPLLVQARSKLSKLFEDDSSDPVASMLPRLDDDEGHRAKSARLVTRLMSSALKPKLDSACPEQYDDQKELVHFNKETRNDTEVARSAGSVGTKFIHDWLGGTVGVHSSAAGPSNGQPQTVEESIDGEGFKGTDSPIINVDSDGSGSSGSAASSDSSSASDSSEEEVTGPAITAGSKRSRSQARRKASKARELQSRVCGDLLGTMGSDGKRRVLRWAERDFSWFDRGTDVMEIVANRAHKPCTKCAVPGDEQGMCEESILVKLWKDMSWRKVRRMKHRKGR